jgi:hypothetical protein
MDATDSELGEAQYYGCCVVDLYNAHRTHAGGQAPAGAEAWTRPAVGRVSGRIGGSALWWAVSHAEGRVTRSTGSACTAAIYKFVTHRLGHSYA